MGILKRSTSIMLARFMIGSSNAPKNTSLTDRALVDGIQLNSKIRKMRLNIQATEMERNSTYGIHTQISELAPNLEANNLINAATKSNLKVRINNLLELLKQGMTIDTNLTALDKTASGLKEQLYAAMKAYFSKKSADSSVANYDAISKTVDERAKEADLSVRSMKVLFPQLTNGYDEIRSASPGTLNLKPLTAITAPVADKESTPSQLTNN